jgi:hypothetical protein
VEITLGKKLEKNEKIPSKTPTLKIVSKFGTILSFNKRLKKNLFF